MGNWLRATLLSCCSHEWHLLIKLCNDNSAPVRATINSSAYTHTQRKTGFEIYKVCSFPFSFAPPPTPHMSYRWEGRLCGRCPPTFPWECAQNHLWTDALLLWNSGHKPPLPASYPAQPAQKINNKEEKRIDYTTKISCVKASKEVRVRKNWNFYLIGILGNLGLGTTPAFESMTCIQTCGWGLRNIFFRLSKPRHCKRAFWWRSDGKWAAAGTKPVSSNTWPLCCFHIFQEEATKIKKK